MNITLPGEQGNYVLSAYGNWTTPLPTEGQLQLVKEVRGRIGPYAESRWVIMAWRRVLSQSGAVVVGHKGNGLAYVIALGVLGLSLSIVILVAAVIVGSTPL